MNRWIAASLTIFLTLAVLLAVPLSGLNAQSQPAQPANDQPEDRRTRPPTVTATVTGTATQTATRTPTATSTATVTPTVTPENECFFTVTLTGITGDNKVTEATTVIVGIEKSADFTFHIGGPQSYPSNRVLKSKTDVGKKLADVTVDFTVAFKEGTKDAFGQRQLLNALTCPNVGQHVDLPGSDTFITGNGTYTVKWNIGLDP